MSSLLRYSAYSRPPRIGHSISNSDEDGIPLRNALAWTFPSDDCPDDIWRTGAVVAASGSSYHYLSESISLSSALEWTHTREDAHDESADMLGDEVSGAGLAIRRPSNDWSLSPIIPTRRSEIIIKEIADWLDLDSDLRRVSRDYEDFRDALAASNFLQSSTLLGHSRETPTSTTRRSSLRDSIALLTTLQLLACSFTPAPPPALTTALYMDPAERLAPGLISALRYHSLVAMQSPAQGHQPRNSSVACSWPGLFEGENREERLADEITRRRVVRARAKHDQGTGKARAKSGAEDTCKNEVLEPRTWDHTVQRATSVAESRRAASEAEPEAKRRKLFGFDGGQGQGLHKGASSNSGLLQLPTRPEPTTSRLPVGVHTRDQTPLRPLWTISCGNTSQQHTPLPITPTPAPSNLRALPLSFRSPSPSLPSTSTNPAGSRTPPTGLSTTRTGRDRWTVQPVVRSIPHPVFVQPVRELSLRRRRRWRSRWRDVWRGGRVRDVSEGFDRGGRSGGLDLLAAGPSVISAVGTIKQERSIATAEREGAQHTRVAGDGDRASSLDRYQTGGSNE